MDITVIMQEVISGTLAIVLASLILGGLAWLVWPLRWRLQGRTIRKFIADERRFQFLFNPEANRAKEVTFLPDGEVGTGKNENESTWRIRRGALEIFGADGKLYSRFRYDRARGVLKRTNDPELRSISGQLLQPRSIKVEAHAA